MKIPNEKIVFCMKILIIWSISSLSLFISLVIPDLITSYQYDITKNLFKIISENNIHNIFILFSLILSLIYGWCQRKRPQIIYYTKNEISNFDIFLDYYSLLLPTFVLFFGLALFCYSVAYYYNYEFSTLLLIIAVYLAPLIFITLYLFKRKYDNNTYITQKMANDIFINYIYGNEDFRKNRFYVKKFSVYLNKSINNIDRHLINGIKIEDLEYEKTFPIKTVISKYLPVYIGYGTQNEIDSLKYNFDCISNLINSRNQINYLDITKLIFKIYVDIKDFLVKRNYKVSLQKFLRYLNILLPLLLFFIVGIVINVLGNNTSLSDLEKGIGIIGSFLGVAQTVLSLIISLRE